MDQVIPNGDYSFDELKFFVESGLSWLPTMDSASMNVHNVILENDKIVFEGTI